MGEFSYAQTDYQQGYGFDPYAQPEAAYEIPSYQEEVSALVPANVPLLAAILQEMGVLTAETLEAALARQAETGDSLAQVLLDGGWAAPDQLVYALQQRAAYR